MPSERFTYVSATLVREIARLGGPLTGLVPPAVEARLDQPARIRHHAPRMSIDTIRLADRMQHIALSPTMKGTIEAERLRRQGVDVVDLGAGEPDFPTPRARHRGRARRARRRLHEIHGEHGHDGAPRGRRRRGICQDYGVRYQPDEVIITAGGKQALAHAAFALFRPGRRGHHARAGLADDRRADQAGGRDAGDRARARRGRLRAQGRRAPGRGDAAHARLRDQLARQSDRRVAVGSRSARARRRGREARPVGRHRPLLREAHLQRRAAQPGGDLRRRRCAIASCCADRRRRPTR